MFILYGLDFDIKADLNVAFLLFEKGMIIKN
jgi:hypothetical protein